MRSPLIIPIILAACNVHPKEPVNCEQFRLGAFTLVSEKDGSQYQVTRLLVRQLQYDTQNDTLTSFSVKWINDCEYELTRTSAYKMNSGDSSGGRAVVEYNNEEPTRVRIIKTDKNYYVFEAIEINSGLKYSDTMWIDK